MHTPYRHLYWDLDGTLTDPLLGITRCAAYALRQLGLPTRQTELRAFIGPPLEESFRRLYGLEGKSLERAISLYRQRFERVGWRENAVIPGMESLLQDLRAEGVHLSVATSKPDVYADRILRSFGLRSEFEAVFAGTLPGPGATKSAILSRATRDLRSADRAEAAMIGDHSDDMRAARECGISGIAVSYGYGSLAEIQDLGPVHIVSDIAGLRTVLLGSSGPATGGTLRDREENPSRSL